MKGAAALVALACLVLTACGPLHRLSANGANSNAASSTRVASPPRLESPSPPAVATPTPPTISTAACRLPISYISEAYGWFVNYPGGATTQDPTSRVALPGGQAGAIGQNPGLTYDRAAGKWVPVPYDWLAPSGHTYAYEAYPSNQIYAVSVPGADAKLLGAPP